MQECAKYVIRKRRRAYISRALRMHQDRPHTKSLCGPQTEKREEDQEKR